MTISQVESTLRTKTIQQTLDVVPRQRLETELPSVPLGPVQQKKAGPAGIKEPSFYHAKPRATQVVKRRANTILAKHRQNIPCSQLTKYEVQALSRQQVGRSEAAEIRMELRRTGHKMRRHFQLTGQTKLAAVAATMSRAPVNHRGMSVHEALESLEAMDRLQSATGVTEQTIPNLDALEQTPAGTLITEFYIGFTHDLALMVGPDFEPSGFKFFLSTDTPALDNSNAIREIDVPLDSDKLVHDTAANTYYIRFGETDSDLQPGTQYYLWAIAYNSDGDSIHSDHVFKSFTEGVRGDLNGDGEINMIDINKMLEILLDGGLPWARADLNQDGENTQEDLDLLVDMVNP